MSYMEKLLDGVEVEWKALGKIGEIIRGNGLQKKNFVESGFPAIHYGQLYTRYGLSADKTYTYVSDELAGRLRIADKNDLLIATTSENDEDVLKPLAWLGGKSAISGDMMLFRHKESVKYLAYCFQTGAFQKQKAKYITGAKVRRVSKDNIAKMTVPIPPLNIQKEIVRILDAFTELTTELTTELIARKKQYNYYRDQLLTFEEGEVEWKTLGEVCDYVDYRGKTPKKTSDGIFLVTAKNIRMGYIDYQKSKEYISVNDYDLVMRRGVPEIGDILITTEAPCGFVAQVDRENIALAQRVIKYRSKNKLLINSFLKHYLIGGKFQKKLHRTATGSTVKGIKGSKLHKLTIPIPTLAEQERIVSILDKFDALTHSINEGLPREIEFSSFPRSCVGMHTGLSSWVEAVIKSLTLNNHTSSP